MNQFSLPKDPTLLLSVVNTKLRDYYPTLEQLCEDMDVTTASIINPLKAIDYVYDAKRNQFV